MISTHAKRVVKSILNTSPINPLSMTGAGQVNANENLKRLRKQSLDVPLSINTAISRGILLNMDTASPREVIATSPVDTVVRLQAQANTTCRWMTLNIVLGSLDLTDVDYFGIAVQSQSHSGSLTSRFSLRSGNPQKFRDCFFDKHMVSSSMDGKHFDVLDLNAVKNIPLQSEWRDLVCFFPEKSFDFSINKMSIFLA